MERTVGVNFVGSVSGLIGSTKQATDSITKLGSGVLNLGKTFTSAFSGNFKPLIRGVVGAVTSFAKVLLLMPGFLLALVNPTNVAQIALSGFSSAISASSPEAFVAATRNMAPAMKEAVLAVRLLNPQLKNLRGIIQQGFWLGFAQNANDLARVYFPILGAGLGSIASTLGKLREQFVQFLLKPQVVAAIRTWINAFAGLGAPLLALAEKLMPTLISLFTSFASILTHTVVPVITFLATKFAALLSFIAPVLSGVSSVFTGAGGGTGAGGTGKAGGGLFSGLFHGIGSFFSGIFGGARAAVSPVAGARAAGGPVAGGLSYLVGERGPEVVTMGGNGNVAPNTPAPGHTFVTVKIGETELRGMITSQIQQMSQEVALTARMGRGVIV